MNSFGRVVREGVREGTDMSLACVGSETGSVSAAVRVSRRPVRRAQRRQTFAASCLLAFLTHRLKRLLLFLAFRHGSTRARPFLFRVVWGDRFIIRFWLWHAWAARLLCMLLLTVMYYTLIS